MVNVFLSTGVILLSAAIINRPTASLAPQRLIEATQSSAVTGWPSWNFSPSRSVKDHFIESFDTVYLSTICGLIFRSASSANNVSKIM